MTAAYAPNLMKAGTTLSRLRRIPRWFAASEFAHVATRQRERVIARERRIAPEAA